MFKYAYIYSNLFTMALQTRVWAGGAGPALAANHANANTAREVANAIGMISRANMFGAVGGIPGLQAVNGWRVDRQNAPGGFINISVQRNGVPAPSTIASVFVPGAYNVAPPGVHATAGEVYAYGAKMRELERAVRRGLEASLASYAAPVPAALPNARVINRQEVWGNFSG